MTTAVLLSGGLDSAVLLADEAARRRGVQPIYVSVGLAWEARRTGDRVDALLAADPSPRPHAPAGLADRRHARRLRRHPLGGRRDAAGVPHARRRRVSAGTQHHPARKGRRSTAPRRHRPPRARHARAQSVSRRHAGISSGDGPRAVARPRARRCTSTRRMPARARPTSSAAASRSACRSSSRCPA